MPPTPSGHDSLRDFIASPRLAYVAAIATALGVAGAFLALLLLRMIALFTNLFFLHPISTADAV